MNAFPYSGDEYRVGGSLSPDARSYVKRQADTELCEGLRAMKLCYVLNSRQMGKSSLMVQTMTTLTDEGFACIEIDMRDCCTYQATKEQFYEAIVYYLVDGLYVENVEIDAVGWWHKYKNISPFHRLIKFVHNELLHKVTENIVIFIDEIDSIINLDFKDDFFWFIQSCYKKRALNSKYNRLTFALLGVATPFDLIEDNNRTPFNTESIPIELTGFQIHETEPLQAGLLKIVSNPEVILKVVLDWTGGQPFLTQKLCQLILSNSADISDGDETKFIGELVQARIIDNWLTKDNPPHLETIRDRILRSKHGSERLLKLYEQILQQGEIAADDDSPEQRELRLSGLVVKDTGKLRVYNRIYESVFNQKWVDQALEQERECRLEATTISNTVVVEPVAQGLEKERDHRLRVFAVREAIALGIVLFLSFLSPLQAEIFNLRIEAQARYRNQTKQLPKSASPPVLLIAIDQESLKRADIDTRKINPMDRAYLAELVERLSKLRAKVIGLDYLLDNPAIEDRVLVESIHTAFKQQGTRFVFASWEDEPGVRLGPIDKFTSPQWSLQGDVTVTHDPIWEFPLSVRATCDKDCPFAYLLAIAYALNLSSPKAPWNSSANFLDQVNNYLNQIKAQDKNFFRVKQAYFSLGLQPIIDFSIPHSLVYERIPAWKFRELLPNAPEFQKLEQQVAIIAPGGYGRANDNFPVPGAVRYWRSLSNEQNIYRNFTGGEAHAYMIHHLLSQHRVVLISPWVMVVIAAILGKGTSLMLQNLKRQQQKKWVVVLIGTTAYGIVTLQIYISASVLIPWFLPSAIFWIFSYSVFRRKSSA